ncbi:hypothetical protein HZS_1022 [Henneguya salminicola]|uniref:Integrin beta-6 (Trinotate prediction) n=1 Tax=Henneguya salminicola TaxID=69463 RepID=A0A6G3MK49_HENSL|nr:hypothetical protein HZS_1022 [Henneguya salminicola]
MECFMNLEISKKQCEINREFIVTHDLKQNTIYDCNMKTEKNCFIYYRSESLNSSKTMVYVKPFNKEEDCSKPINWNILAISVFASTLFIGLIICAVYFILIYIHEKRQFQRFMAEKSKARFLNENPLYGLNQSSENPILNNEKED